MSNVHMDADETRELLYDLRDGKISAMDIISDYGLDIYERIIHGYTADTNRTVGTNKIGNIVGNMVKIKDCKRGDIIVLKGTVVVLVSNDSDKGIVFTALPNSYIAVEGGAGVVYGNSDSGYDYISANTSVERIGHIELY